MTALIPAAMLDAVEKRDLMHACVHEYAHLHVARHFGVFGFVNIERNPDGGLYEALWVGKFAFPAMPAGGLNASVMALAGYVAEHLLENRFITTDQLLEELAADPDDLSSTDAKLVGKVTRQKVEVALWLVRKLWSDIVADATLHASGEERAYARELAEAEAS